MNKKYKMLSAKIIAVLVTMCLLFTACGGQNQETAGGANGTTGSVQGEQPDQTPRTEYLGMDQSTFEHQVDLSTISVKLTAGADVTLYMDENGTILAAHCHNDEAIAMCSATPVVELDFGSVWFALLNEMLVKGYLENGSRLAVNIVEEEGSSPQFPLYDVIDEMFQKVAEDSGADIGMNMNSGIGSVGAIIQGGGTTDNQGGETTDDQGRETTDDQGGETTDNQYLEAERDQSGNLVRTVEEDPEGNCIERYYDPQGWVTREIFTGVDGFWREQHYSAEHKLIREQRVQPDGTEFTEEYYENGEMKSMTSMNSHGVYELSTYREDGTQATYLQKNPDGSKVELIMNEKGICSQIIETTADGTRSEITHDEKGDPVYELQTSPDGTVKETMREYNDDHKLIYLMWSRSDGATHEEQYDDQGRIVSKKEVSGDGSIREARYNEQGVEIWEYVLRTDGYQSEVTYSDTGKPLVENAVYPDGRTTKCIREYDEKDLLIKENWTYGDGGTSEIHYYANGRRKSCVNHLDNGNIETWQYSEDGTTGTMIGVSGTRVETYYPNGSTKKVTFTTLPSAGLDFTYEESTYDENGTMLTHTKIRNNGIIGVSTYHYDKSHTTVFTYPDGGGHTEYWYGNNLLGGIDSNGNPWGTTVPGADYSGMEYGGTIGKG